MNPHRRLLCFVTGLSFAFQTAPFIAQKGIFDTATVNEIYLPVLAIAQEKWTELAALASAKLSLPVSAFSPYHRQIYQYQPSAPLTPQQQAEFDSECGEKPFTKFFQQYSTRRSRLKEDRIIYSRFFGDVSPDELRTYKYIEIGGYNGMDESNSRFFETCLGWDGLLIEPNPIPFQQLIKNRPHAHRASFAASCSMEDALLNKTIPFHDYPYANAGQAGTDNPYKGRHTVNVPCGPLTPLIQDLFGGRVQFFSLDVEGAEPLVLEQIDFSAVFIDILLVEVENTHCRPREFCLSRNRTRSIMQANGYHRFEKVVSSSDLFVHPQSTFISKMNDLARSG